MEANVYLVGGAVRDLLMGQHPKDRDYVVVGGTPELMLSKGFEQVGADFPVFLCPKTNEEYALARIERKSGRGYNGFEVDASRDVTLEDDLARRDLTINSMAIPVTDFGGLGKAVKLDEVIDPYNGREDLKNGVLRHTTAAFAEDPLRVLRVARFAARYNFTVHPTTVELCASLVSSGELDDLTPERVWKEVNRAVMEPYAHRFFEVLAQVDALNTAFMRRVFKDLDLAYVKRALAVAASLNAKLDITLGLLTPDHEDQVRGAKQDKDSFWVAQQRAKLEKLWTGSTPEYVLGLLNGVRAFHDDGKLRVFFELVNVMELLRRVPSGSYELMLKAVQAAEVVKPNLELQGKEIGLDLQKRRLDAIAWEAFNLIVR